MRSTAQPTHEQQQTVPRKTRVMSSSSGTATNRDAATRTTQKQKRVKHVLSRKVSFSAAKGKPRTITSRDAKDRQAPQAVSVLNRSTPGSFVDARKMPSEDVVRKTLDETTQSMGVVVRPKVLDFANRHKERRSVEVRTVLVRAGIIAAVIAAIAGIIWVLFFSPMLRLDASNITVSGANDWVNETRIMSIARTQAGKSLLLVSDAAVEDDLKNIPGVSQAEATKKFPNKFDVSIVSQRPAAMLKKRGTDQLTAVDSRGRILNSVEGKKVDGIPVIEVDDAADAVKSKGVLAALTILDALPEWMRSEVTQVTAATQDSIITKLNTGVTVDWGSAADLKLKLAVVDKIINDPNILGNKTEVNVSAPQRPIIK
ncbi:POTRA domain protein, FtsQ-type [Bifidobacterium gallicum DSM 20093 = LMG 11596]|nr:POTRA domain protein, FtsQ-type [Bifidobacterium gallicum DSM 20093 = LMG 11596]